MKKNVFSSQILVFNSVLHLIGIIIFISGFLPMKTTVPGYANHEDIPYFSDSTQDTSRLKIVLVVVDALAIDFIPSLISKPSYATMPFLEELIANGSAQTFISRAHSPTVTLPRIKAMMSGTIPAFVDVILNLDAVKSQEDSLLYQAHRARHKVVFFGDDTWVKLYESYFHSYEGTTSFFVNDFIEVDHNVTRHLDKTLKDLSWDWLILHYLGLDHIGHLLGHTNSLIKPKLKEMDDIIKRIYKAVYNENYMIVITGDHGMTASGSHGGATPAETLTPLIFVSKGHVKNKVLEHVWQIDIAPTMSALMGLPIPKNSIGKMIPSVLEKLGLTPEVVLKAIFRNANQVANVLKVNQVFDMEDKLNMLFREHKNWLQNPQDEQYTLLKSKYLELMRQMSEKLERSVSGYDIYSMILGCLTVCAALLSVSKYTSNKIISFLNDEMIYTKIIIFVPSLIISCGVHFSFCMQTSHHFCASPVFVSVPVLLLTFFIYHIVQCSYLLPSFFSERDLTFNIESFVVICAIFNVISLGSSSFVEEEHQTWYFFTTTLVILMFLGNIYHMIKSFDITLEIGFLQRKSPGNFAVYRQSLFMKMSYCLGFLILARVCRSWNQTGNKWIHLPDIGDYLQENRTILAIVTIIALVLILVLLRTPRITQQCCLLLAILGILAYHLESVKISGASANKQAIAWFVYLAILAHLLENVWIVLGKSGHSHGPQRTRNCVIILNGATTSWLLLCLLLCRTHNVPLFLFMVLQEKLLQRLVWKEPVSFFVRTCAYLWTSNCAFFYQGNSNMISTLDVSAGYVGLSSYQPVIVGFLMVCNTYSGLVYFLLQYVTQLTQSSAASSPVSIIESNNLAVLLCLKYLSVSVYLAVLVHLRHHLFIWTVFCPKLLYEGAHSLVFTAFVFLILYVNRITKRDAR